jgi:pyruvate dehydrogenase E2 component (dihydrolipoyllysine-residue acetyltransferase)
MSIEITMPKLSDTMEEGTVLLWHLKRGDRVKRGDVIAEVETDKAAMEMEAYEDGVVVELKVAEGETVPVGTLLAILAGSDESVVQSDEIAQADLPALEEEPELEAGHDTVQVVSRPEPEPPAESVKERPPERKDRDAKRQVVSPAARRLADKQGVDVSKLHGSGPGGRIILVDIEAHLAGSGTSVNSERSIEQAVSETHGRERRSDQRAVKIRRIMARKMTDSWQTVPHFYVTFSVDMTDIIRFRKDLGLTINDFILAGVTQSLLEYPWVNSWWVDGEAVEQPDINIALAIATDRGLYNPVIKNCAELSLKELSRAANELGRKAHAGKLTPEDLEGGTFTVSNMGMLGVDSFRAIITPPEAAVLAVGTVKGEVVVDESGEPAVAPIMRMTLAADHRILDGADAAEFMATLKSYLEAPVILISH